MLGIRPLIEAAEAKHDMEDATPQAKEITLWLPLQAPPGDRLSICKAQLFDMEFELREGQCSDALASLRTRLFARQHLLKYRNSNITGQHMSTRAQTMIDSITDKIDAAAMKYHGAQEAMRKLQGEERCGRFCVLLKDDVAPVEELEKDDASTRKLGRLGGQESCSQKVKTSKKNMSWIWTEAGGQDEDASVFLHECKLWFRHVSYF